MDAELFAFMVFNRAYYGAAVILCDRKPEEQEAAKNIYSPLSVFQLYPLSNGCSEVDLEYGYCSYGSLFYQYRI